MDPRKTFPNLRLSVASQFVWCTASQRDHSKLKRTQTRNRVVTIAAICTRNSARVNDEMSKHSTAAQRAEWHLKRVASFEETENLYRLTYVWPEAWKWYALLLRKFKETRTSSMGNKDVCINLQLHFALDGDTKKNIGEIRTFARINSRKGLENSQHTIQKYAHHDSKYTWSIYSIF